MATKAEERFARLTLTITQDVNNLLAAAKAGASTAFVQAQLAQLARMTAALGDVQKAWVEQTIPQEYRNSAGKAQLSLEKAGAQVISSRFTGVDRRAIEALSRRVSDDLDSVRTALGVGLALGDPLRLGPEAVARALEGDNRFIDFSAGQARVKVPSGRLWKLDAYSKMLSRTAVADARRVAFRQRYLQNGQDRVVVVANGTTHDVCAAWEGKALSLTGATPGLPTVSDAASAGLFHPNCAHRYVVDVRAKGTPAPLPAELPTEDKALPILGKSPPNRTPRPRRPAQARAKRPRVVKAAPPQDYAARAAAMNLPKISDRSALRSQATLYNRRLLKEIPEPPAGTQRLKALRRYQSSAYKQINAALRRGQVLPGQLSRDDINRTLSHLDRLIQQGSTETEAVVHRGVRGSGQTAKKLRGLKPGDVFGDTGYGSWSTSQAIAEGFSGSGGVLIRTRVPKGTKGAYTNSMRERELLLQRGSRYRVLAVEEDKISPGDRRTTTVITVELTEPDPDTPTSLP